MHSTSVRERENTMSAASATRPVLLAMDVDPASLLATRRFLPEWSVQTIHGASAAYLAQDGDIEQADLLVLGVTQDVRNTLGLCRMLRSESGRAGPPLVVLVPAEQPTLGREVMEAGANDYLLLPIQRAKLVDLVHKHKGMAIGHAPDPDRVHLDRWQDEGGQG